MRHTSIAKGLLSSDRVSEIGRQLCAGLEAAHAKGVLHRDLKPANVLIDEQGQVRITDFGLAVQREAGGGSTIAGTPAYMAPEQLTPGATLSERTDLYALGVVLYELVAGQHPLRSVGAAGQPLPPSIWAPGVDRALERAIIQAISPAPEDRPASAAAMAALLPGSDAASLDSASALALRSQRRSRFWMAAGGLAVVVAVLAIVAPSFLSRASALTEQDTIVLADFANTTGDPVFDGTLKVALAVALEQSPFLKVYADERMRETLRLMERPVDEPVTPAIARELARREQLKALLAGSIGTIGSNYVITLEAVNAETGEIMASEQAEAAGKEQVLTSLGLAASRLREKLGESLASIEQYDVPLPRATTSSLEALQSYSRALDEGRIAPRIEAIPHLKRAIELDPEFALALALLSGVYANTGQSALAPEFSRRAFELRDRVSERERFFISWRYYRDAAQAWDKALELTQAWTAGYPREAIAFNSLGIAATYLGKYDAGCRSAPGSHPAGSKIRRAVREPRDGAHRHEPLR